MRKTIAVFGVWHLESSLGKYEHGIWEICHMLTRKNGISCSSNSFIKKLHDMFSLESDMRHFIFL